MAEKRMFSKTIIDSDLFLDMSPTAQLLYFHLGLRADDEGFINSPKKVMRMIGATNDDFKILIAKEYLIPFESGVVVITHWLIHNAIRKDRIKPTFHKLEKEKLYLTDNNTYTLEFVGYSRQPNDTQLTDKCQHRLDKNRLDKNSIDKEKKKKKNTPSKIKYAEFVSMKEKEYDTLIEKYGYPQTKAMIEKLDNWKGANGKIYKSDYRAILSWVVKAYNEDLIKYGNNKHIDEAKKNNKENIEADDEYFESLYDNVQTIK